MLLDFFIAICVLLWLYCVHAVMSLWMSIFGGSKFQTMNFICSFCIKMKPCWGSNCNMGFSGGKTNLKRQPNERIIDWHNCAKHCSCPDIMEMMQVQLGFFSSCNETTAALTTETSLAVSKIIIWFWLIYISIKKTNPLVYVQSRRK